MALAAIRGGDTVAELASRHRIHPNVIAKWKRMALDNVKDSFVRGRSAGGKDREAEIRTLRAKIGELVVERDFLSRARSLSVERGRTSVDRKHPKLSVSRQCRLLSISRGGLY